MLIDVTDNEESQIGKQRLIIPVFDFYSNNVGDGTENKHITTFAYEVRTSPTNATIVKKTIILNII